MLNGLYSKIAEKTAERTITKLSESREKKKKSTIKDFLANPDEFVIRLSVAKSTGDININIRRNPEWEESMDIHKSRKS